MTPNIDDIMRNQENENTSRDAEREAEEVEETEKTLHSDVYVLLAVTILGVLCAKYLQYFDMPTIHGKITTSEGTEMDFSSYSCAGTDYFASGRIIIFFFMFLLVGLQACIAHMKIMQCAPSLGKISVMTVMFFLTFFILVNSLVHLTTDGDGGCMNLHPQQWRQARRINDKGVGLWTMIQNHDVAYSGVVEPGNTVAISNMIDMFVMSHNVTSSAAVIQIRLKVGEVREKMLDGSSVSFFGIWLFIIDINAILITIYTGIKIHKMEERSRQMAQQRVVPLEEANGGNRGEDGWEIDTDPTNPVPVENGAYYSRSGSSVSIMDEGTPRGREAV